ncbi:MAG: rRNA maturation RNase YbeY [Thermomicrobia bacterium]|nr:rRNA maturation RNase YbeY [Thermomicrobia bacterium]
MDQADAITILIESEEAERAGLDAEWLRRLIAYALRSDGMPTAAVTLLVTDDAGIQSLHRDYLHDDTPTDVLSFTTASDEPFPMEPGYGNYLGDIAVSWETAAVQGPEAGFPVEQEVAFLALHGLLHLLGADDATDTDRAAMHDQQHALLRAFLASGNP